MYSEILLKVDLVYAAEGTKKIAQSRPQPLDGVNVNLSDSVAIIIARPDTLARCMANRHMVALRPGQTTVGTPFVGGAIQNSYRLSHQRQIFYCVVIKHISDHSQTFPASISQLTCQD